MKRDLLEELTEKEKVTLSLSGKSVQFLDRVKRVLVSEGYDPETCVEDFLGIYLAVLGIIAKANSLEDEVEK